MTLLMVYGTLKQGYGNHYLVEDGRFLGKATTLKPYLLWHSGFPIATHNQDIADRLGEQMLPVIGEVYEVSDTQLRRCDSLEGHPRWYKRVHVQAELDNGNIVEPYIYEQNDYEGHRLCRIVGNKFLWERV